MKLFDKLAIGIGVARINNHVEKRLTQIRKDFKKRNKPIPQELFDQIEEARQEVIREWKNDYSKQQNSKDTNQGK